MSNCAIAMAFIMQHPKISIIMVESSNHSNPQRQTDPTKRTSEASLVSGPPYGQMFDDYFRFRLINKSFFFSMMIALLKSAFTMISDRNFSWISKSLWKPVSYMHFFFFLSRFLLAPKGRAKVLPKAASSRYWRVPSCCHLTRFFVSFSVERTSFEVFSIKQGVPGNWNG